MADPIKVDSPVHLYRTVEEGLAEKAGYEVWKYSGKPAVCYSENAGMVHSKNYICRMGACAPRPVSGRSSVLRLSATQNL